jgi:hypothetical protein
MSDDKTKRSPQDAARVNVHEDYEVEYWTHKFGVTRAELEAAVKKVGTGAEAVGRELART